MNIKEYYGYTEIYQDLNYYGPKDTRYTEEEVYNIFKNNESWKLLVFKVRIIELIDVMFPTLYSWIDKTNWVRLKYPTDIVNMVNKWEKK